MPKLFLPFILPTSSKELKSCTPLLEGNGEPGLRKQIVVAMAGKSLCWAVNFSIPEPRAGDHVIAIPLGGGPCFSASQNLYRYVYLDILHLNIEYIIYL